MYPSWQRGNIAADVLVSGAWDDGNGTQDWREWEFPWYNFDEFFTVMCKLMRGKPCGPWVTVPNSLWAAEDYDHPAFRQLNYDPGNEDYTHHKKPHSDGYRAGYDWGHTSGYEAGYGSGYDEGDYSGYETGYTAGLQKGMAKGKGKGNRKGTGQGKAKGQA